MRRPRPKNNRRRASATEVPRAFVFPSALGWMSLSVNNETVVELSFGHGTPQAALASLSGKVEVADDAEPHPLVHRLQEYAKGSKDDFRDVEVDCSELTPFQRRIVQICRKIPFGSSLTYGELAARAGHPRAARAVGSCMRMTRVPLIVPCHRVVGAGSAARAHSACEATRMKLRLLEMESCAV